MDKYKEKLRLYVFVTFVVNECDIAAKPGKEPRETAMYHKGYCQGNPGSNEVKGKPDVKDKHQKYGV